MFNNFIYWSRVFFSKRIRQTLKELDQLTFAPISPVEPIKTERSIPTMSRISAHVLAMTPEQIMKIQKELHWLKLYGGPNNTPIPPQRGVPIVVPSQLVPIWGRQPANQILIRAGLGLNALDMQFILDFIPPVIEEPEVPVEETPIEELKA